MVPKWQTQEAEQLKLFFSKVKNRAKFCRDFDVPGGAAMLYQHINGLKPISLEAGKIYAIGLGVPLEQISPRLADAARQTLQALDPEIIKELRDQLLTDSHLNLVTINSFDFTQDNNVSANTRLPKGTNLTAQIKVTHKWLERLDKATSQNNIFITNAFNDTMSPLINLGDTIFIDTGVVTVNHDGVYLFELAEEIFLCRIQRIPGKRLLVIPNNSYYQSWEVDESLGFKVLAKALAIQNYKKL